MRLSQADQKGKGDVGLLDNGFFELSVLSLNCLLVERLRRKYGPACVLYSELPNVVDGAACGSSGGPIFNHLRNAFTSENLRNLGAGLGDRVAADLRR
jgi:hypothetical protein